MPSPFWLLLCICYGNKKKKLVEYLAAWQLIMGDYVKSWSKKWKIINQESRWQNQALDWKKKHEVTGHWEPGAKGTPRYHKSYSRTLS